MHFPPINSASTSATWRGSCADSETGWDHQGLITDWYVWLKVIRKRARPGYTRELAEATLTLCRVCRRVATCPHVEILAEAMRLRHARLAVKM